VVLRVGEGKCENAIPLGLLVKYVAMVHADCFRHISGFHVTSSFPKIRNDQSSLAYGG